MDKPKLENLPLEWIRVFEAAGRLGSFTAAAVETGLTQAAISQRIRNLEGQIGTPLFTRLPRGVALTIEGEAWLPYVSAALLALSRSAEDLFGKPLKQVVISAPVSVMQLWVTPRLILLSHSEKYEISLVTMNVEGDFTRANSMVEIRYGDGSWPNIRKAQLFKERLVPMCAPEILDKNKTWQTLPSIAVSGPRPGWQEWSMQMGMPAPEGPVLRFDSFVSAYSAAISGGGVILGSLPLCATAIAEGRLTRLSDKYFHQDTGYWMTSKEGKMPRAQWDTLVRALCGAMPVV